MLNKIDLSFLSEEERSKVLGVVQRDLAVRAVEKERLKRCRSSILRRDRELAAKTQNAVAEANNCLLCGQKFVLLFQPRKDCVNCGRPTCRRCSEPVTEMEGVLCKLCIKETGYRAMKCNWFYDTVMNRFREFGSTAVAKNIFGDKYKHIQNMAEEELATMLRRHGSNASESREFVVNDQKVAPQAIEDAKDAQVILLRKKLQTLMQNTAREYQQLDSNTSLNENQKNWQIGRIGSEFRNAAATQMRAFSKTMYITTERHRTMQGTSSRNITQQVMTTLRDEVIQLVGHPIEDQIDTLSITSDDDLESVAYAEREGVEERMAQILLDKVLEDKHLLMANGNVSQSISRDSSPMSLNRQPETYTAIPTVQEHIVVVEGSPTRMEMKIDFDENCEFSWLRENANGNRVPVKFDFHIEHVITGSTDPSGCENFVLSNSGHYSSEACQSLIKTNQELLNSGAKRGVIIQHQLIIWAAKLDDAGRYFAVARTPSGDGITAMQETEFRLEVERAPRWPIHPLQPPEFIQPLSLSTTQYGVGSDCLELSCTVASNPTPRCLFYKNNSPVPVVIMPLLNSEQDMNEITLSSFSRKYAVISRPYQQKVASVSVGYLRRLILRISNPSSGDVASYTCRAWNYNGRTETSAKITINDLPGNRKFSVNDDTSLSSRVEKAQTNILSSALNVENAARTHGDILDTNRNMSFKPPQSPGRIVITSETPDRVRSLSTATPSAKDYRVAESENSSISNAYKAVPYQRTTTNDPFSPTQAPRVTQHGNTFIIMHDRELQNRETEPQTITEIPVSPTSDVGSEISSIASSPFQRTSLRRSSGPKVVIDRRSQKRRTGSTGRNRSAVAENTSTYRF